MMVYLSECKFGDRLEMRNGKMAIYVGKEPHCALHFLVMDNLTERSYDIVGKWEDEK